MKISTSSLILGLIVLSGTSAIPTDTEIMTMTTINQEFRKDIQSLEILELKPHSVKLSKNQMTQVFNDREEESNNEAKKLTLKERNARNFKIAYIAAGANLGYLILLFIIETFIISNYGTKTLERCNLKNIIQAERANIQDGANIQLNQQNQDDMKKLNTELLWLKIGGLIPAIPLVPIVCVLCLPTIGMFFSGAAFEDLEDETVQIGLNGAGTVEPGAVGSGVSVITRQMVEAYEPKFRNSEVESFNYLIPDKSMNKHMKTSELRNQITQETGAFLENYDDESPCPICLCKYENDNTEVMVFPCGHYLHYQCLVEYKHINVRRHNDFLSDSRGFKCFICQLSLLNHYLFYREQGYPASVKYDNRS